MFLDARQLPQDTLLESENRPESGLDRAYTENSSFPYTPSDLDPPSSKFGLNHPQTAGIRKRVPFRTPAGPAAIRSAFMIEADQTFTAAACPQMTQSRHLLGNWVNSSMCPDRNVRREANIQLLPPAGMEEGHVG